MAALGAALVAGDAAAEPAFLYKVPTSQADGAALDPSGSLRLAVYLAEPALLAAALGSPEGVELDSDHLRIELPRELRLAAAEPETYLDASFLIDFDEPSFSSLRSELEAAHPAPSIADLVRFAGATISKESPRGWDTASRVATRRRGDCTEHAVLLAALARATGRPSRVIIGAAVVYSGAQVDTFGHAWTEIHDGAAWRRYDATGIDEELTVFYIPEAVADESPGFLRNAAALQSFGIQRVQVLGSAGPEASDWSDSSLPPSP